MNKANARSATLLIAIILFAILFGYVMGRLENYNDAKQYSNSEVTDHLCSLYNSLTDVTNQCTLILGGYTNRTFTKAIKLDCEKLK